MNKYFTKGQRVKVDMHGNKPLATVLLDERTEPIETRGMGMVAIAFRPHYKTPEFPKGFGHRIESAGDEIAEATSRGNGLWIHPNRLEAVTRGRKPGSKNRPKAALEVEGIKVGDRVIINGEARFVREPGPGDRRVGTVMAIEGHILGVSWDGYTMGHNLHAGKNQPILSDNSGWWVVVTSVNLVQSLDLKRDDIVEDGSRFHVNVTRQAVKPRGWNIEGHTSYIAYGGTYKGLPAITVPFTGRFVTLALANGDKWNVV